jgi:hypothetical protein
VPGPAARRRIAEALGVSEQVLWPSVYAAATLDRNSETPADTEASQKTDPDAAGRSRVTA